MRYEIKDAKEWAREHLSGYVAAVFTPYAPDGTLDLDALRRDVEVTLSMPGIGGVYVGSIYQEFWLLSEQERMTIAEVVLDTVSGRVPVTISATETAADSCVRLASHARDAGADLVMLWPPIFGPRSQRGVLDFYDSIMRNVDIGFAFYNSGLSEVGFEMEPGLLSELASRPNMCLLKEASLRLDTYLQTLSRIGSDVLVSSPLEEFWLVGRMLYPDIAPKVVFGSSRILFLQGAENSRLASFLSDAENHEWAACAETVDWIVQTSDAIHGSALRSGTHPVALVKALRSFLGQSGGFTRPPIPSVSEQELEDAAKSLRSAGIELKTDSS